MKREFIGIGMYSVNFELEKAWQELFLLAGKLNPELALPVHFLNTVDKKNILSNETRISHICGLPLVSHYKKKLIPLFTPHFDLDGLEGPNYFSYFMVSQSSQINSVDETKGLVASVNSHDSHSGANVFRSEIEFRRELGLFNNFYKKIVITGSHKNSIQSIIDHETDIACVDAMSFFYLSRANPKIANQLKIIGRSMISPAPPFVTHKDHPLCSSSCLIEVLNTALNLLDQRSKDNLKIKRFSFVPLAKYDSIINQQD